jgi:hypothetical protein
MVTEFQSISSNLQDYDKFGFCGKLVEWATDEEYQMK